jgi:hypothetical protein
MFFGQNFHLHELKQGPQGFILKHEPPILQNMEKGSQLNNLALILFNHGVVKLSQN